MEQPKQTKEYPNVIIDVINDIAENRVSQNTIKWMAAVDVLHDLTSPYHDDVYLTKLKALNEKREIDRRNRPEKEHLAIDITYYREVCRSLIMLIGRSGFLEIAYIDGIIDSKDVENGK